MFSPPCFDSGRAKSSRGPADGGLPQTGRASMSVVEVDDPQLVILLHFMTPFMAIQPIFESPLARPASLQGSMASQLLIDLLRDRPGAHGMLLVSIEQDGKHPSIYVFTCSTPSTSYVKADVGLARVPVELSWLPPTKVSLSRVRGWSII
ncbi:hypothetical protein OUZ56_004243 [Daphnia magna]|uniref:Uncharacterized protein n=1 Tax=Daphnia magna TaxID=35525 RepID=A0ABQ9YP58_9CRUS|nr:hypothetical protein OUZ56_004243 [Daphnia magna]